MLNPTNIMISRWIAHILCLLIILSLTTPLPVPTSSSQTTSTSSASHTTSRRALIKKVGCTKPGFVELQITSSKPHLVRSGDDTTLVEVPDCTLDRSPGLPILPRKFLLVAIPPNARFTQLQIVRDESVVVGRVRNLAYFTGNVVRFVDGRKWSITRTSLSQIYPLSPVSVSEVSIHKSLRVVGISYWPVQWNPLGGELIWHRKIVLRIYYEPWLPLLPYFREEDMHDAVARRLVINYQQAVENEWFAHIPIVVPGGIPYRDGRRAWLLVERPGQPGYFATQSFAINPSDNCDICIICRDDAYPAFYQLKLWKEARGTLKVNITCLNQIFTVYGSGANGIRNFLIDAWNTWSRLKWVVLGYDCRSSPQVSGPWWVYTNVYYYDGYRSYGRVSDVPFAHLDVPDLDPNGDGLINGPNDVTSWNYYPEVFVGRMVCNNLTQAWNCVNKTIFYEGTVNHHAALLAASSLEDDGDPNDFMSLIYFCLYCYVHNITVPWNPLWNSAHGDVELYGSLNTPNPYGNNWTDYYSIVGALNLFNYSLFTVATHGSEASNWLYNAQSWPDSWWRRGFSRGNVAYMSSIVGWYTTCACLTGCWDNREQGPIYSDFGDCLAEVLVSGYPDRGAVCAHAASESQWGWVGTQSTSGENRTNFSRAAGPSNLYPCVDGLAGGFLCLEYKILFQCGYRGSYPSDITGYLTVGEVFHLAKYYYTTKSLGHSTWYSLGDPFETAQWNILNLFGDPSLDPIRTATFFKDLRTNRSVIESGDTIELAGRLVTGYRLNSTSGYWEPGNVGVASRAVEIYVSTDQNTWTFLGTALTRSDGSWNISWTAPSVPSVTTFYFLVTFDGDDLFAESRSVKCIEVIVAPSGDTTPPSVAITSPTSGSYYNSTTVLLTWVSSDNLIIAEHEVWVDGSLYADNLPYFQKNYTVTGLGEGVHQLEVRVYDAAGNNESDAITITIDITPPNILITNPPNGTLFLKRDITVEWVSSDNQGIDHFDLFLDGVLEASLPSGARSYSLTNLSDGNHAIEVVAIDVAGNRNASWLLFAVDTEPPSLLISYPSEGAFLNTSDVEVRWSATDAVGVAYYLLYVNGTYYINTTSQEARISLGSGEYTVNISVVAVDMVGHNSSDYVTIHIDTEPPRLSVHRLPSYVNQSELVVQWSVSDRFFSHAEWYLDGVYGGNLTANETLVLLNLSEGVHLLFIAAYDKVGWCSIISQQFRVDLTPPTVSIKHPDNGSYINKSEVFVEWTAEDAFSGIERIAVFLDGAFVIEFTSNAIQYKLKELSDGPHTVTLRVYDVAGNVAVARVFFIVDTVAPHLLVLSPENNSVIESTNVTLVWSCFDNGSGVLQYLLYINASLITVLDSSTTNYTLTNLNYNTTYVITLVASDYAGNNSTATIVFHTRSPHLTPPTPPPTPKHWNLSVLLPIIAMVVVISSLLVAVLLLRRRLSKERQ